MTAISTSTAARGGGRVAVQKFGTFLSGMIMPNIAAIIAWGIITAFFIPVGWTPNATFTALANPTDESQEPTPEPGMLTLFASGIGALWLRKKSLA